MTRRTKIVATLGPASHDRAMIERLLHSGVDVFRLNLSHGEIAEHLERLRTVRAVVATTGRHVAVFADLPGPKIRAGSFPDGGAILAVGSIVSLVPGDDHSDEKTIEVDVPGLLDDVEPGDRVALGDGVIALKVVSKTETALLAEVTAGGRAQGRPGIHLSCEGLKLRAPTDEDLELADQMAAAGIDYLGLSFCRSADDVARLRAVIGDRCKILAKIETAGALDHLAEIALAADAIMVARGDLGIDVPIENVPHLQKRIIRGCVEAGIPVVTATQMLESMIVSPSPTRAEVSDVANAVFDGTDAVMLSGETAIGHDPELVVATMSRIAERAEVEADYRGWGMRLGRMRHRSVPGDAGAEVRDRIAESITHAAWQAAADVGATAIICCTRTGRVARMMARFRPEAVLIGASPNQRTLDALTLSWGAEALDVDESNSTDDMVWFAVERAVGRGLVAPGDTVIVIAGAPDRTSGAAADVMRIVRVS